MNLKHALIGALLLGTLGCRPNQAGLKAEDDRAHLFSADAVQEADFEIRDLKSRYRLDLKIETFARVPRLRDVFGKLDKMTEEARAEFYGEWARDRARNVDGVYVLICQDQVQAVVSRNAEKLFSAEDAEQLRDVLLTDLRAKRADDGLRAAVHYVQQQLETKRGAVPAPQPFDWAAMTALVLVLAAAWLMLQLARLTRLGDFLACYAGVSVVGHGLDGHGLAGLRQAWAGHEIGVDAPAGEGPADAAAAMVDPDQAVTLPHPQAAPLEGEARGTMHDAL